jgi:signal peptidase I
MIVDRRAYEQSLPDRDDIVVARYGKDWVVKRIVGLPGEEVEVKKGKLFIDGALLAENHPLQPGSLDVAKGRLLEGDFATLGDNRTIPAILAVHPIVSRSEMLGKVIFARSWLPLKPATKSASDRNIPQG